jgi:hypothetical protein
VCNHGADCATAGDQGVSGGAGAWVLQPGLLFYSGFSRVSGALDLGMLCNIQGALLLLLLL